MDEKFKDFIDCDVNAVCDSMKTDEDIIENVQNTNCSFSLPKLNEDDNEMEMGDADDSSASTITNLQVRDAVQIVRNGLMQHTSVPANFFSVLNEMEQFLKFD